MKRLNLTLFGVPLIGIEASSTDANGKTLREAAQETATRVKQAVNETATAVANATETDPARSE